MVLVHPARENSTAAMPAINATVAAHKAALVRSLKPNIPIPMLGLPVASPLLSFVFIDEIIARMAFPDNHWFLMLRLK